MTFFPRLMFSITLAILAIAAAPAAKIAPLPTYTQAYEPQSVDERGLWMMADDYERRLRESPLLVRDPQVSDYVRRVLCETVGADRCKSVRIYVLEVPAFNASMGPNGAMTVWTGMLLRVHSEAEFGAVLGHEFAHFELRHTLQGFKQRRGATDAMAWIGLVGAMTNTNMSGSQYSLLGGMFRFNREQEASADTLGLQYLKQSRYPATSAAQVWSNVMAEDAARAAARNYKAKQAYTAGFFDTHPTSLSRAEALQKLAAADPDPGDADVAGHQAAIAQIMPQLLAAEVKRNDFGASDYIITELAKINGWTPNLLFARGELYRERGNPRDLVTAAQFYQQAIDAGLVLPEAYRGLGLALMRNGDQSNGRAALSEYLKRKPDAGDAKLIQTLVSP